MTTISLHPSQQTPTTRTPHGSLPFGGPREQAASLAPPGGLARSWHLAKLAGTLPTSDCPVPAPGPRPPARQTPVQMGMSGRQKSRHERRKYRTGIGCPGGGVTPAPSSMHPTRVFVLVGSLKSAEVARQRHGRLLGEEEL